MPAFFSVISSFFSKIFSKEYLPFTLVVIIFGLLFIQLSTCNRLRLEKQGRKQDREIYNQNFEAFLDTLRVTYNKKLGAYEYDKKIFLTTLDELEKYDRNFALKLEGIKGELLSAIETGVSADLPTTEVDNEVEKLGGDKYGLRWDYNYADSGFSQHLSGSSRFRLRENKIYPDKTIIDTNKMTLNITYGFRELDNKYKVWAISKSPVITINELDGAYFIDKPAPYSQSISGKKPWVVGPYIGWGVNFDNKFQDSRLGWNFGVSIQYNLFNFGKSVPTQEKKQKKSKVEETIDNITQ